MADGILKLKQNYKQYKHNTKKYAPELLERHSLENTMTPLIKILKE